MSAPLAIFGAAVVGMSAAIGGMIDRGKSPGIGAAIAVLGFLIGCAVLTVAMENAS